MRFVPVSLAPLLLAACVPAVQNPPEKQVIADAVHAQITGNFGRYNYEGGVKVLAACIKWEGSEPVGISSVHGYYYPTATAAVNRPMNQLERNALGDCTANIPPENRGCECQIVDKNGQNAILVP